MSRNRLSGFALTLGALVVLAFGPAVVHAWPITGTFQEPSFFPGHWTESFMGLEPPKLPGPSQVGNIVEAASWDGATLGGQWALTGANILQDTAFPPAVYGLLKVQQYLTEYTGGATLTLKAGPWTELGDGDYTVTVNGFTQSTIVTTFNNVPLTVTAAISMTGTINGYPGYEMNYLAATSKIVGQGAAAPAGYPGIVPPAIAGQWGTANDIQMQIIPEPATLGLLMLGGAAGVMFRRRRAA